MFVSFQNIPDVPIQPEYDDSFNAKFESTFSTFEEMKLSRQNSDSATSYTENSYPFQKNSENYPLPKKCDVPAAQNLNDQNISNTIQDNSYQELQLLRQLSKAYSDYEKCAITKEEPFTEREASTTYNSPGAFPRGRKSTKTNKSNKYLNPVLNEIEPRNRKIDKIVENLKCNQMRSQEVGSVPTSDVTQLIGNLKNI